MNESSNGAVLVPNMPELEALVSEMFVNANTSKMSYANPNATPQLMADGYTTKGGYVRTTNKATLNGYKSSTLTNDELCFINGVVQTYTPPTTEPAPTSESVSPQ